SRSRWLRPDEDLCRICRSPEEPGNPLRYPCLCRGSIKYVHQDCLRLWLNRRGYKKCEVCGRSYSIVPVYSENAPDRLPCNEFVIWLLLRAARYMKSIVPWILVILFNAYFNLLHPILIVCFLTIITVIRIEVGDVDVRRFIVGFGAENGLQQGVIGGVVQVLWKYMKILCDWYAHKFVHFLGLPHQLILVPPNALIHECGLIRRLLFFLNDDAFAFLAISVYVSLLFLLVPFWIGWTVLANFGGNSLAGNSPVILGYMVALSTCFAYFGIPFILRQNSFPIIRWFSLGFRFIAGLTLVLPCLLLTLLYFSVKACKNIHLIKDALVLCFKIAVLPWIIGCWLEFCASPMLGTKISQSFEIFSQDPFVIFLQCLAGLSWLAAANASRKLIPEIIHKRAFWYLLDVTDPEYKITKLYLGHTFYAFACHGVLLVILFHLPIKAITMISPSIFPLQLWVTKEKHLIGVYPIYFNLLKSNHEWLIKLVKPAIKLIVDKWIITVSSWLQLSDFLLVVPRGGDSFHRADQHVRPLLPPRLPYDRNPWFRFYSLAEGSMVNLHGSQNAEDDIKDQRDNRFLLRIALMLVLAALSMFIVSTTFLALPIMVGRVFLDSVSFIILWVGLKHDDLCAFWIGCDILVAIYISICLVYDHIQKGRIDLLLKDVLTRIQNGLFVFIWISIVPVLLGLLIDLMIIIPLRVPLDESPIYFLVQDWLIGVVVLHIWAFMTMFTPINWFATEAWRRKLERIRTVGTERLPSMWLLQDVIGSSINTLLTTLAIPYMLGKYLFPLLGYSKRVNSAIERFIWPALLTLIVAWFIAKLARHLIIYLHQLVFDERYLVGERVENLTEDIDIIHGV
ncbi:hypothetical protein EUTSA_v10022280mg, partial [Eutrema salsugineum]